MSRFVTAAELGLLGCHRCGHVLKRPGQGALGHCDRCGATLHRRKPQSLERCWALLIAAMILYVPANTMTMMRTTNLLNSTDDTIISGVIYLWVQGSWELAAIVFIASVMVPISKFIALLTLLITVQRGSDWDRPGRTRLYRIIEKIGHWSMLDVFVVALLVALVHFDVFGRVEAGGGAVAFGAVVVLTMLASMSFDPRLIWDPPARHD
ncbi:MAG TPA: paraquat-inducible protein A [Solimonas sp.]